MRKILIFLMCGLVFLSGCSKKTDNEEINKNVETSIEEVNNIEESEGEENTEEKDENEEVKNVEVVDKKNTEKVEEKTTTKKKDSKTTTTTTTKKNSSSNKTVAAKKDSVDQTETKATTTTTTKKTTTTTTKKSVTVAEVKSAINSFKSKYPTGTKWDSNNYYAWQGGTYSGGYGCAGFAFMLSDAAFGSNKAKKHTDFDNIKVGDIVRYLNDTHSVIVLGISGDTFTIVEGNMNGKVFWERKVTRDEFKASGTYVLTRW